MIHLWDVRIIWRSMRIKRNLWSTTIIIIIVFNNNNFWRKCLVSLCGLVHANKINIS